MWKQNGAKNEEKENVQYIAVMALSGAPAATSQ